MGAFYNFVCVNMAASFICYGTASKMHRDILRLKQPMKVILIKLFTAFYNDEHNDSCVTSSPEHAKRNIRFFKNSGCLITVQIENLLPRMMQLLQFG